MSSNKVWSEIYRKTWIGYNTSLPTLKSSCKCTHTHTHTPTHTYNSHPCKCIHSLPSFLPSSPPELLSLPLSRVGLIYHHIQPTGAPQRLGPGNARSQVRQSKRSVILYHSHPREHRGKRRRGAGRGWLEREGGGKSETSGSGESTKKRVEIS